LADTVKNMNKILRVKCPQCATIFSYYSSEFRPFCTERCKLIDLGHWFEESYRVPEKNNKGELEKENEEEDSNNYEQNYSEEDIEEYEDQFKH
jgi:endogenous inhibitor of DNA gyrase (YacG/DUF329 family)